MTIVLVVSGCAIAIVVGIRSTWSPCGVSMLSTFTPIGERGRGRRYATTALWFVIGATAGGASIGMADAALAAGFHELHAGIMIAGAVAVAVVAAAVATDVGIPGFRLPVHHRQVNERWIDEYRGWVCGAGFGWQIGTGVATYITTAAVYSIVAVSVLAADPVAAVAIGSLFGLTRGLCILPGRRITTPDALRTFHRRFGGREPRAVFAVVVVELVSMVAIAGVMAPLAGAVMATALVLMATYGRRRLVGSWNGRRPLMTAAKAYR